MSMNTTKLGIGSFWLEKSAAASFLRMIAAAGTHQGLAAAGRTYAEQQRLYKLYLAGKGNLAARPGTSRHEKGNAVDVSRRSPLQLWMTHGGSATQVGKNEQIRANEYGWFRTVPSEAWHFTYDANRDKRKVRWLYPTLKRGSRGRLVLLWQTTASRVHPILARKAARKHGTKKFVLDGAYEQVSETLARLIEARYHRKSTGKVRAWMWGHLHLSTKVRRRA